jgi:enediyne biosynthesis protein E4
MHVLLRPSAWAVPVTVTLILAVGCDRKASTTSVPVVGPESAAIHHDNEDPYDGPAWFEDMTAASGINFTYRNGEEADHMSIIESLGGGVAAFDYDGDGLIDLYFTGGGYYEGKKVRGHAGRMYKNLGNFKFKDVTKEVGLDRGVQFSHGVAVGDINRDGFPDLLVTGYDRLTLYLNVPAEGGRKFEDVTEQARLTERMWSSGAAFADLDGDGYPDLYVCHYGDWGFDTNHPEFCTYDGKTRDVCPPKKFKPLPHTFYRNNRDGTFTEMSKELKLRADGKGLGVLIVDVNGDGKPDLYVANDTDDNFLYLNRTKPGGPLAFEELGGLAGVARDNRAQANGSMGLDAGDPVRTGRPALFVTNYEGELHALYVNQTTREPKDQSEIVLFDFESHRNGLQDVGRLMVGWGTAYLDLDRDGWEDLVIAHGHAIRFPVPAAGRAQFQKLLLNEKGKFIGISNRGGSYFRSRHNGRGMAVADLDNDGKPDLVFNNLNEPAAILRNVVPTDNHWVGFELSGEKFRDITGGRIVVEAGGETHTRFVKAGGSYASVNDRRYVVGIGKATKIDKVTVHWAYGKPQEWKDLAADRYWKLTEGQNEAK